MLNNKYIAWISIFVLSVSSQDDLDVCKKVESTCVPINSCDYVINLIRQGEVDEAKTRFCGFENRIPKVCCPKGNEIIFKNETEPAATTRPKRVTTPKPVTNETVTVQNSTNATATTHYDLFPNRTICGQVKNDDRIIGGQIAGIDEYPWMARLKFTMHGKERYACGGSLITNRHILTAAHCVATSKVMHVRLGEFDENTEQDCIESECNDKPLDVLVKEVIVHPEYKENTQNDIALLVLAEFVNYTDFIQPVCLPTTEYTAAQDYIRDGTYMTAGWGLTEHDSVSAVKRKVMLHSVPITICEAVFQTIGAKIPKSSWSNIICAGGKKSKDSCQGDSGGPLVREVSENYGLNWFLFGVTSFGSKNCGEEGIPGVYTRVSSFMDWIREQVART